MANSKRPAGLRVAHQAAHVIGKRLPQRGETIKMRLKQLLGILLLAGVTTLATGSVSELAGVRVENHDNASVITIRANGTFTHTEYRPSDTLMLVDLGGVSIAQQDANVHPVSATGVLSYRVMGYRSASGAEVARIELNLAPGANVKSAMLPRAVAHSRRTSEPSGAIASGAAPTRFVSNAIDDIRPVLHQSNRRSYCR